MNRIQNHNSLAPETISWGKKLRRATALGAAGLTVAVAVAPTFKHGAEVAIDHIDGPDVQGSRTTTITPGDNLTDIATNDVLEGSKDVRAVVDAIQNDPRNKDIFENGPTLGPEDIGQELVIPESVKD